MEDSCTPAAIHPRARFAIHPHKRFFNSRPEYRVQSSYRRTLKRPHSYLHKLTSKPHQHHLAHIPYRRVSRGVHTDKQGEVTKDIFTAFLMYIWNNHQPPP